MAVIAKTVTTPGLATKLPCGSHRLRPMIAGEPIAERDACYIKTDGTVWRSIGTAVAAAAKVHGYALLDYDAGDTITLYNDIDLPYGPATLTPGAPVYLAATAGALDTGATTGGTAPIGHIVANVSNEGTPHSIVRVFRSTY